MDLSEFKALHVIGDVWLERCTKMASPEDQPLIILLMGMTGAGKSSFLECLAGDHSLGISKDQLDGVTTEVVPYELVNVVRSNRNVYIVDTPGFSDRKLSEMKIVKMIQDWMKEMNLFDFGADRILFFDRITDIRMSGSKQRRMNMFKALTGQDTAPNITIVTSMWDQVWNEAQLEKANDRMRQLQEEHWKDFIFAGSQIVKFENTQKSAFHVLNKSIGKACYNPNLWFGFELEYEDAWGPEFAPHLHQDLLDRKLQLSQRLEFLREDKKRKSTKSDTTLMRCVRQELSEVERDLKVVMKELKEFGPPPDEMETEEVPSPDEIDVDVVECPEGEASTGADMARSSSSMGRLFDSRNATSVINSIRSHSPIPSIHRQDVVDVFHRTAQKVKSVLHLSRDVSMK